MQIYLGSVYVNDFNKFGRTYQVSVQADAPFRARADDIGQLKVRSTTGEMVPLSALVKVRRATARTGDALQRLSRRRHQRRPGARLLVSGRRRPRSSASPRRPCRTASASSGPS